MIWAATFVPALVMLKPSSQPMPPVPGALPTTLPGELLSTLDPLRIQPGQPFRGATASMIGFNSGELAVSRPFSNAKIAQLETLWRQGIPTLEEYSQLVTSPSYLVVSRILAGRGDNHMRNLLIPRRINPALMKALGVRMVISNTPLSEGVPIGHFTDERGQDFYIFEWPDYNYGNYSPTNIIPVNSASEAISRMAEGDMDYRNNVIVQNGDIDATPLTKATFSEIVFNADSKIDLAAGSTGTSIVIIPIQFSRCLYVDGDDVYLFRANLMETGILFKGKIQVRITNRFDIFHPACRLRDISDMKRLDITALRREREAKGPSPTGERK
ncbi:hypothetical protein WV31_12910 [Magnetospirillum sp. ME-1]|nr:hypothetical protein WV31_12910 [Magnetospirillum sp. ME-1]